VNGFHGMPTILLALAGVARRESLA
jgi:hypothetical protein